MEKGHAEFWKLFLKNRGFDLTKIKVSSLKTAFYALFLRIFGLAFTFRLMESGERDAVLGMNDGLVEILSVTAGLAGAYGSAFYVALSGLVVAVAGALSMGIGAFVAARAQRQVHEGTLSRVLLATRYAAHVFKERIRNFTEDKGYSSEASLRVADESMKDPKLMARIISEEEYGLKEEKLENPAAAGLYTGLAYLLSHFYQFYHTSWSYP